MSFYNRVKTWASEVLFAADLNAEFNAVQESLNSVATEQLAPLAVTADKIATEAVDTGQLVGGAVTLDKIEDGACSARQHVHLNNEIDFLVPLEEYDVIDADIQLATPAGHVLVMFQGVLDLGYESSAVAWQYLSSWANVRLFRNGVQIDVWNIPFVMIATVSGKTKVLTFQYLDTAAEDGSFPNYKVTVEVFVPPELETEMHMDDRSLTLVEFRR